MTIEQCVLFCQNSKSPFAGLADGNQCHCGSNFGSRKIVTSDLLCNATCAGNNQTYCGSTTNSSFYNVYSTYYGFIKFKIFLIII